MSNRTVDRMQSSQPTNGAAKKLRFVSILTLDRLPLTRRAVRTVLDLSVEDVRLVIHDNGSGPEGLKYLDNLENTEGGRVKVLRAGRNIGVAAGRNAVLRYLSSEYANRVAWVLNMDNDCYVHRGYDVATSRCLAETRADAVCPNLLRPDGAAYCDTRAGFQIRLDEGLLKLKHGPGGNPPPMNRFQSHVLLGTSIITPSLVRKLGLFDEGHGIGWEDYSASLAALGLKKADILHWRNEANGTASTWIPLRELLDYHRLPTAKVVFEPGCRITHDHVITDRDLEYEKARWDPDIIEASTRHFEARWGLIPVI